MKFRLPSGRYSSLGSNSAVATIAVAVAAPTRISPNALTRTTNRVKAVIARTTRPARSSMIGSRSRVTLPVPLSRSSRDDSPGITVTATSRDSSTETEIATAMSRNNWPTSSCMIRMGMNTITVVKAETSTAPQTWAAP